MTSTALAEWLGVAPASITNMLQKLASASPPLVQYECHKGARLSPAGRRRALEIVRHHRLLEAFLYEVLNYPLEEVRDEAGGDTGPKVVPYSFNNIVACLNQVVPNEWEGFLTKRLHALSKAPLQGISGAGYRLVYKEGADKDFQYSLAISIGADGVISDVLMGEIAYQADFGPGMKVLAVNGQPFARATLQQAIDAAKTTPTPIDFKVDNTGVISDLRLDYHGGQRHPVLERVPNTPDRIAEILQPMSR